MASGAAEPHQLRGGPACSHHSTHSTAARTHGRNVFIELEQAHQPQQAE